MALAPADAWTVDYQETFALELARAECEYLVGNLETAQALVASGLAHARSIVDRARVYSLRLKLAQLSGHYVEATRVALEGLGVFGLVPPESDAACAEAVAAELDEVAANLRGRAVAELLDAPRLVDEEVAALVGLLVDAVPCAYIARPAYFPWLALEALNLSLRFGHCEDSCFAYMVYGLMLAQRRGRLDEGLAFADMALALAEKLGSVRLKGTLLNLYGTFVHFLHAPFAANLPRMELAFRACIDAGDLVTAGFNSVELLWQTIEVGTPLEQVLVVARQLRELARASHNQVVHETLRLEEHFVNALAHGGDDFDETEYLALCRQAGYGIGIIFVPILKQVRAFLFGRHEESLVHAAEAAEVMRDMLTTQTMALHHFVRALSLAQVQPPRREAMRDELAQLRAWAEACPENFAGRVALVAAELARLDGHLLDAEAGYEDAIAWARAQRLVHHEGIALELAASFYRGRGRALIADTYLAEARAAYARWGAQHKVDEIDRAHPHVHERGARAARSSAALGAQQLDALSVVKASQAISGQVVLERLLETLMRVVLESAGAQRACLVLERESGPSLLAEASAEQVDVRLGEPKAPLSLLSYVRRTRERVLLDHASASGPFVDDPYFVARRTRSAMALPVVRGAELLGVLYLENDLASRAFTPERAALLDVLAMQAAISLDNARLVAELRDNRALFGAIIDNTPALVSVKDREGRYVLANRRFQQVFQLDPEHMRGRTDREIFPAATAEEQVAHDREVLGESRPLQFEERFRHHDGVHTYLVVKFPLNDAICSIATDISERKLLEEQLLQAQKMESIGRLAGGVAHDFNNLLSIILSYSNLLLKDLTAGKSVRADIAEIRSAGERAAVLTRQLLAFGRQQVVEPRVIDVRDIVNHFENMIRRLIGEDIELRLASTPELGRVKADAGQVEQIILNLVVNARDAMPRGGVLVIETANVFLDQQYAREHLEATPGPYVMLAVRDTGVGMDEATRARMFEPFFTTKQGKGTGLGLSIVYGIVRQSGGHMWVESEPGQGTTFKIYLPRTDEPEDTTPPPVPKFATLTGTETVLLVEDEQGLRAVLGTILQRHGYRVLAAEDGVDALRLCAEHDGPIHVMLTDVVMPRMNGRELADRVAALRPHVRILYMSGYTGDAAFHQHVLESRRDLLHKPITPTPLLEKLREMLARR
jgi:PAS domain S-box-containing protein